MANWHFKNLDLISSICKNYSEDPGIPDKSRQLFSKAFKQTRAWKHSIQTVTSHHVGQARELMCEACKATHLCKCKDSKEHQALACPLVRVNEN